MKYYMPSGAGVFTALAIYFLSLFCSLAAGLCIAAMPSSSSIGERPLLSRMGICLSYLEEFLDIECTGIPGVNMKTATTGLIYEKIIKPKSPDKSLCESWRYSNADRIGSADVFISHCWNAKFIDTVKTLMHHFRETPDVYIWMDIFSYHTGDEAMDEFEDWCHGFGDLISSISHSVLVMSSFREMVPLKRLWCLYECHLTIDANASLELAMLDEDVKQALDAIQDDSRYFLAQLLDTVSVTHARCTNREDYTRLNKVILASPTAEREFADGIVRAVCRCLVEFTKTKIFDITADVENRTAAAGDSPIAIANNKIADLELKRAYCYRGVGTLLMSTARVEEAAAYVHLSLDHQSRAQEETHNELMKTQIIQCALYYERAEYDKAEALCRKVIAVLKASKDVKPRDIIDVMSILARTFSKQSKTPEADKLFRACDFMCGKYLLAYTSYYNPPL